MSQFSKKWKDLTIADNFIFCKVMQNEQLCRRVLETLLEIKIEHIEYLSTEMTVENFYESRGIRLDVYVKDSARIFNIEMQTGNYEDMLLRARYYLSSSDVATTKRRSKFKDLKETFILFICKDDPFGIEIPRYTRFTKFLETDEIPYDDKIRTVFYNCSAWEKESDPEIRGVLKFIYGLKPDSNLASDMEKAVSLAKQKSEVVEEYMYFSDILEEEKEEASKIARAEALAEGFANGQESGKKQGAYEKSVETAIRLLKMGLTVEQIAEATELTLEEVNKLKV